jgi:hypothetical protein
LALVVFGGRFGSMLLKKSFSTADQNFSRLLMRFSDKTMEDSSPVKKLPGGFDNGLGATLIGEHSLASFLSRKNCQKASRDFFNSIGQTRSSILPRSAGPLNLRRWTFWITGGKFGYRKQKCARESFSSADIPKSLRGVGASKSWSFLPAYIFGKPLSWESQYR